jgi:hypothetical protein
MLSLTLITMKLPPLSPTDGTPVCYIFVMLFLSVIILIIVSRWRKDGEGRETKERRWGKDGERKKMKEGRKIKDVLVQPSVIAVIIYIRYNIYIYIYVYICIYHLYPLRYIGRRKKCIGLRIRWIWLRWGSICIIYIYIYIYICIYRYRYVCVFYPSSDIHHLSSAIFIPSSFVFRPSSSFIHLSSFIFLPS